MKSIHERIQGGLNTVGPEINQPEFSDLAMEDQLDILKNSTIGDLLELADANKDDEEVLKLLVDTYKQKFNGISTKIYKSQWNNNIYLNHKSFTVHKFDEIFKLFTYFGNHISKVVMSLFDENQNILVQGYKYIRKIKSPDDEAKEMFKLMNKVLGKTLLDLKITENYTKPFQYVFHPFENVENFTLDSSDWKEAQSEIGSLKSDSLGLNEILPKLKRLNINQFTVEDDSLAVPFKELEDLKVRLTYPKAKEANGIDKLIENNQQLKNVSIPLGSISLLKSVAKLSQLENLDIVIKYLTDFNNEQLNFGSVKRLKVEGNLNMIGFANNANFDQLEELEIIFDRNYLIKRARDGRLLVTPNEWIKFIQKNTQLKQLHLDFEQMYELQIVPLTGLFPNLVDASFTTNTVISSEAIVGFIKGSGKLNSLIIRTSLIQFGSVAERKEQKEAFQDLKQQIGSEWNIKTLSSYGQIDRIVIQRK